MKAESCNLAHRSNGIPGPFLWPLRMVHPLLSPGYISESALSVKGDALTALPVLSPRRPMAGESESSLRCPCSSMLFRWRVAITDRTSAGSCPRRAHASFLDSSVRSAAGSLYGSRFVSIQYVASARCRSTAPMALGVSAGTALNWCVADRSSLSREQPENRRSIFICRPGSLPSLT